MDIFDIDNPASSAFNENILMEKIGVRDATFKENEDINKKLHFALLKQELTDKQNKINELNEIHTKKQEVHNKCHCKKIKELLSGDIFSDKFLLLLVIILSVFCLMQYFTHKSEMQELMELVKTMINKNAQRPQ